MSIRFWLRKNQLSKQNECPLWCTISLPKLKKYEFSTNYVLKIAEFNQKYQRGRGGRANATDLHIEQVQNKLLNAKITLQYNKIDFTCKDVFDVAFEKKQISNEVKLKMWVEKLKEKKKLSKIKDSTIKHYELTKKNLSKWGDLPAGAFTFKEFLNWVDYLLSFMGGENTAKHINHVKSALKLARIEGVNIDQCIIDYGFEYQRNISIEHLSNAELTTWINSDAVKNNAALDNARKLYLLGVFTFCGYDEVKRILEDYKKYLQVIENKEYLIIERSKTNQTQIIPFLDLVRDLLNDTSLHIISNAKINEYIKIVASHLQITKTKLVFHTARKSGANWLLRKGFSLEQIAKILGQKRSNITERHYVNLSVDIIKNDLDKLK